ncbi:GlxA family transcriptional regulator [Streptomyces sp. SBT349]|uniref:GlxA family transcriptional regulator n=1 Tax=Streptomyces sp. SBT349 TaxID=1580539 RepID=UPI00066E7D3E|nr:helix-turn-helix domain-containing protein [Streptomyces sp. SBT349]
MHTVAVLALEGVVPFDLVTPVEVFGRSAQRPDGGGPAYRVLVCGTAAEVDAGPFALRVPHGLDAVRTADTVIVPGVDDAYGPVPEEVCEELRAAHARGARLASICVGTFVLAATGLLNGLRATTHWLATDELARRYPEITVDPDVLYVDNGSLLTSAGAAAGLDLCLHMVRRDFGAALAADAARAAVMPLERDGGQAQFIVHPEPVPDGASLEPLLGWMRENAHRELRLEDIARRARLSTRTLNRRFREQTGTTPLQWLHRARIRKAQHLLETTGHSIERIATQVGFGSPTSFRDTFKRLVGTSPLGYRRAFRV